MFKVNEYFDGKVKSIAFQTATLPATVGVMDIGEYEFGTSQKETITVISGELNVQLPEQAAWQTFKSGDSFEVEAERRFKLQVKEQTAYLCTYE